MQAGAALFRRYTTSGTLLSQLLLGRTQLSMVAGPLLTSRRGFGDGMKRMAKQVAGWTARDSTRGSPTLPAFCVAWQPAYAAFLVSTAWHAPHLEWSSGGCAAPATDHRQPLPGLRCRPPPSEPAAPRRVHIRPAGGGAAADHRPCLALGIHRGRRRQRRAGGCTGACSRRGPAVQRACSTGDPPAWRGVFGGAALQAQRGRLAPGPCRPRLC